MQKSNTWVQEVDRRDFSITLWAALFLVVLSQASSAEATPFVTWVNGEPNESQITAVPPSPVLPKLSFQTRISQATLPILEGVFYEVIVHYKNLLSTGDCEERFEQVRVLDSVLNLELGLNARCDFARAVAQRSELEMELCFNLEEGSAEGASDLDVPCFNQTVRISSVPYAIKVNYAKEAQSAHQSNLAFMSSYAYRVVDRSFTDAGQSVPPYLSFRTRGPEGLGLEALRLSGEDSVARAELAEAGYVRWHPHGGGAGRAFYIAREPFAYLDHLTLAARVVTWYGPLEPNTGSQRLDELEEGSPKTALSIRESLRSEGDVEVTTGRGVVASNVEIGQGALVESGGLYVDGGGALSGSLDVSGSLEQGWLPPTLSGDMSPSYELQLAQGALLFTGPLTLKPLEQVEGAADSSSELRTEDLHVTGPVALNSSGESGPMKAQLSVSGEVQVNGRMDVSAGALNVAQDLSVTGDTEVVEDLNIGSSLNLLRGGSPQPVLTLSQDTLALNHDPSDPSAAPYYDEVVIRSDVHFANRVTFDQPVQDVGSECTITPARVLSGVDAGKLIPEVFDLNCKGVSIRVSALLESDCGNGIREGEELCDDGGGNFIDTVPGSYCDITTTPFGNCDFFRVFDTSEAICTSSSRMVLGVSGSTDLITFKTSWFNGACALQSPADEELADEELADQELFVVEGGSFCTSADCVAQVIYPRRYCRSDCSFTRCGDGVVDTLDGDNKEECDDGNLIDNDDCDNSCKLVSSCKLKVAARVEQRSALISVDTSVSDPVPDDERRLYFSDAQCPQGGGGFEAPQRVVEVDLTEPTWLAFETYPKTSLADPTDQLTDTFLYLRESCDQVNSVACDDDSGVDLYSSLSPRLYSPGRHYVVVSGYDTAAGSALLGVKMTCADPNKLIATVHHRFEDDPKELVFQSNTATQGGLGHVQENCLSTELPEGFIQPSDPSFDPANARTGLGLNQVAIEVVLENSSALSVSADSLSLDPVIYIKSGCDSRETLRSPQDASVLLCNDNTTTTGSLARLEHHLQAGVYYIIIDGNSLQGGVINISLSIDNLDPDTP